MSTNLNPWETHDWFDRPLEIDPEQNLVQFICRKCARGFVNDATGRRYAIHASTFAVYRLSDEVTARWLAEPCPLERQPHDQEARLTRQTNGSGVEPAIRSR
jgi:hypothetical protein